jgi:glycerophosphoryl diester phosphodiesterase
MSLLSPTRVVAIAHRGGSVLRPENTIVAFDHAVELGVDGLECDVQLSRDGAVVVMHDPTLERTTDGRGPVAAHTLDELERLDAGATFGPDRGWPYRQRDVGVPTLAALLTRYAHLPVVVEIKTDSVEAAERTLAVIRDSDAEDRVIVAGFHHRVLAHVRRLAPHIPTSASRPEIGETRIWSWLGLNPRLSGYRVLQAPLRFRGRQILREHFVRAAARVQVPVHAWIVDRPEDMAMVLGWGVMGLISDRPDLAVEAARAANTPV